MQAGPPSFMASAFPSRRWRTVPQGSQIAARSGEGIAACRLRQPLLHPCVQRLARHPMLCSITQGEVHQDRVRVGNDGTAIVDHRHLSKAVDSEERRLTLLTTGEIDVDQR